MEIDRVLLHKQFGRVHIWAGLWINGDEQSITAEYTRPYINVNMLIQWKTRGHILGKSFSSPPKRQKKQMKLCLNPPDKTLSEWQMSCLHFVLRLADDVMCSFSHVKGLWSVGHMLEGGRWGGGDSFYPVHKQTFLFAHFISCLLRDAYCSNSLTLVWLPFVAALVYILTGKGAGREMKKLRNKERERERERVVTDKRRETL